MSGPTAVVPGPLGDRDVRLLHLLAEGRSTAEIARALSVSGNTARTRVRRVQGKLAVTGRGAAVRAAAELGVLPVPAPRRPPD
ncbi:helix-turn-helix transcriptional regulator [Blastococcus sp. SYSU D00922]